MVLMTAMNAKLTRLTMTDTERLKWPDPVLRVKDAMDVHAAAIMEGAEHGYAVFRLSDGVPMSGALFPSRAAARKEAERKTRDHLLIIEAQPDGMTFREAEAVLKYERTLIGMGIRSPDTEYLETQENSGLLSMPRNRHDRRAMAAQLRKGRPLYPEHVSYGNLPAFRGAKLIGEH